MRFLLFLFLTVTISFSASAHEYFFGFAELSYNTSAQAYEGTLILSTHDVEDYFQRKGIAIRALENHTEDFDLQELIALELFEGFAIQTENGTLDFELMGYEVLENGMTQFYFRSQSITKSKELDITFDLMMDLFPKQQNKINYISEDESASAVFLVNNKQSRISLK